MPRLPAARSCFALLAATVCTASLTAQLQWQSVPTAQSPAPRYGHTITDYGIVYGGRDASQAFSDTWVFVDAAPGWGAPGWLSMPTPSAPSARHGHAMAGFLMFGGADAAGVRNAETWMFSSTFSSTVPGQPFSSSWTQVSPANAPSPREGHAMAYNPVNGTTVLFGGRTDAGVSGETWAYYGGDWHQVVSIPSPPARAGHQLLRLVDGWMLLGGTDGNQVFHDTWLFDGQDWAQLPDMPFAATDTAATLIGAERTRHVLVGGRDGAGTLRTQVQERGLGGAWFAQSVVGAMPARDRAVVMENYYATPAFEQAVTALVFGGRDAQGQALGDTWRLVPTHFTGSYDLGSGCGPGGWSNNGPEIWMPNVILGNTRDMFVFTASPDDLVVIGVQLGVAPAPAPCEITVVPEVILFGLSSSFGIYQQALPIPFLEPLRGQDLSVQSLVFEPTAANGIALSRVFVTHLGD